MMATFCVVVNVTGFTVLFHRHEITSDRLTKILLRLLNSSPLGVATVKYRHITVIVFTVFLNNRAIRENSRFHNKCSISRPRSIVKLVGVLRI